MKRPLENVADNTRSKRPKLYSLDDNENFFISASHLFNYLKGDPIVDWLKNNHHNHSLENINNTNNSFTSFIMKKGINFEESVVKLLTNDHQIVSVSDRINDESIEKTKQYMLEGIPIIHSAPLRNDINKLQGVADLLVRSDYISKLFDIQPIEESEIHIYSEKLEKKYFYIVIDIKYSTLPLRADGVHLLNCSNYTYYKAQCLVYTEAVGLIQGYTAPMAYILGRRNKFTKNGIKNHSYSCFNRLGRISYNSIDKEIPIKMNKAIKWIKDLKKYGKNWIVNPPSRNELYPNMCVDSGIWNKYKEKIAEDIGEITKVWNVGIKNRDFALKKGIKTWQNKRCTSKNLNIKGKRSHTIDSILKINRQNKDKVLPKVVTNNLFDWKTQSSEVFVDFETIQDIFDDFNQLPLQTPKDLIFMIGVGFEEQGEFKYINFCCKDTTRESEFEMMNDFNNFMSEKDFPKMFCWHAEENFWKIGEQRQFDEACKNNNIERKDLISAWGVYDWADLCKIFKYEPIVIKNCFKFGLKSISKALYDHKLINIKLESNCDSGLYCMIKAWEIYQNNENPQNTETMSDIIQYNKFDCKVLWEILKYLRQNHT
tara:strand:+ start:1043 stop:2836 length:1794 start_codon:yes stop_codon:yes gene_type:complete